MIRIINSQIAINNDTDGIQFITIEPAVKVVRLNADVENLEEQLFQKYSEIEDIWMSTNWRSK